MTERRAMRPIVLKFGGELLDDPTSAATVISAVQSIATERPAVIVHGGGKAIDAALKVAGIEKRQVDGRDHRRRRGGIVQQLAAELEHDRAHRSAFGHSSPSRSSMPSITFMF